MNVCETETTVVLKHSILWLTLCLPADADEAYGSSRSNLMYPQQPSPFHSLAYTHTQTGSATRYFEIRHITKQTNRAKFHVSRENLSAQNLFIARCFKRLMWVNDTSYIPLCQNRGDNKQMMANVTYLQSLGLIPRSIWDSISKSIECANLMLQDRVFAMSFYVYKHLIDQECSLITSHRYTAGPLSFLPKPGTEYIFCTFYVHHCYLNLNKMSI